MYKLYVMRHAKSSWDFPELEDHDRPLNKRGFKSTKIICEFFIKNNINFDLVYCSSAKRTIQTLDALIEKVKIKKTLVTQKLYHASSNDLIKTLKKTPNEFKSVLLINHEPSLTELVKQICFKSKSIMMSSLIEKFSTCAVAEIFFNFESWDKIAELKGELINFTKPKQLQTSNE